MTTNAKERAASYDQTIVLAGPKTSRLYPDPLRRISFYDAENDRRFVFLTNNFTLPALMVAKLYKCRWQVEMFHSDCPSSNSLYRASRAA